MADLGDRMKSYEDQYRYTVMPRMPVIIRVDGKAFHSLTRGCKKPFDESLAECMDTTALALVSEIQNARMAFVQSDEISVLLVDYNKFDSQQCFTGNLQKMVSVSASIAGVTFSRAYARYAYFDSRAFALPEHEVTNYFIWRQQDATRNSISMAAQSLYSPKQLHGVNCGKMQEMIFQKGTNWNDYPARFRRGRVIIKGGQIDSELPIFTQDRQYIERFLAIEEPAKQPSECPRCGCSDGHNSGCEAG